VERLEKSASGYQDSSVRESLTLLRWLATFWLTHLLEQSQFAVFLSDFFTTDVPQMIAYKNFFRRQIPIV
jgi:hypothetical protein